MTDLLFKLLIIFIKFFEFVIKTFKYNKISNKF